MRRAAVAIVLMVLWAGPVLADEFRGWLVGVDDKKNEIEVNVGKDSRRHSVQPDIRVFDRDNKQLDGGIKTLREKWEDAKKKAPVTVFFDRVGKGIEIRGVRFDK